MSTPQKSWLERNLILFFVVSCCLSVAGIVTAFLFTGGDLAKTGPIGDTIGGISGPLINLLAAILVYLSFKKQTEANEIILNQIDRDEQNANNSLILNEISSEIARAEESFSAIEYIRLPDVHARGLYAIKRFMEFFHPGTADPAQQLVRLSAYLDNNSVGQDLLYLNLKCVAIRHNIYHLLGNETYRTIALRRLALFYTYKVHPATKEVLDHVRDEVYKSSSRGNAAIGALEDSFALKRLWNASKTLEPLNTL